MVESRRFRDYADDNCIEYYGIRLFSEESEIKDNVDLVRYTTTENNSAIVKLMQDFSGAGADIEKYRRGDKITDRKSLPIVTFSGSDASSITISGNSYFSDKSKFEKCLGKLSSIIKNNTYSITPQGTYTPVQGGLVSMNPIDAVTRTMTLGAVSSLMDSATLIGAALTNTNEVDDAIKSEYVGDTTYVVWSGQSKEGQYKSIAEAQARSDRSIEHMFYSAKLAFTGNTPAASFNNWMTSGSNVIYRVNNKIVYNSKLKYVPSRIDYKFDDMIKDTDGSIYFTSMKISMTLVNAYGSMAWGRVEGNSKGNSK